MPADLTPIPFAGHALFRSGTLTIEGKVRYPNDFSTARLEPVDEGRLASPTRRAFAVAFHRDKEPYCGPDLIGPIYYEGRVKWLAQIDVVRVYVTPTRYEDIRVER